MFHELRWRLVAWYVLLLTGVLALFSAGVYGLTRAVLLENFNAVLTDQAELLVEAIEIDDDVPELPQDVLLAGHRDNDHFIRLFDRRGSPVFAEVGAGLSVPELPDSVGAALAGAPMLVHVPLDGTALRVATYPVLDDGVVAGVLQVGIALEDIERTLQTLLAVLVFMLPATLVVTGGGGLFLARRALAPIATITSTAQQISADNLGGRIALDGPDDEIGRLARTFDTMLARLETAFERQRRFAADASHELRTPLTAIIGQIDVALGWPATAEQYRETLLIVRAQAERLTRLAVDLLLLARADSQAAIADPEPIALDALLPAVVAQVQPLAAARGQTIQVGPLPPAVVLGDEDNLIRLFLNLLENAVRYTPRGGTIALQAIAGPAMLAISVRDSGPGIRPEDLPFIFDRFFRADRGRSRARGGAGLGLAIAQSIAALHGGRITVASAVGVGSTFSVHLPIATTAGHVSVAPGRRLPAGTPTRASA